MPYLLCCFFYVLISLGASNANANSYEGATYTMPSDTTPPKRTGVVTIKELPSKKNLKEARLKKRSAQKEQNQATKVASSKTKKEKAPRTHKNKSATNNTKKKPKSSTTSKKANAPAKENQPTPAPFPPPTTKQVKTSENNLKETKTVAKKGSKNKRQPSPNQALSAEEEIRVLAKAPMTSTQERTAKPSQEQCAFAFDHTDEFTGTRKRGLTPRLFFSYTPEQYREFIKTKDFLRCEGYLSQSSQDNLALNIILTIATPVAKDKFGDITPSSNMTIRTMEGKEYSLKTYKGGQAKVQGNNTVYEASFVLTKADAKQLAEVEIDKVRLRFTQGFQLYEIYYLDFLREQFPCFKR